MGLFKRKQKSPADYVREVEPGVLEVEATLFTGDSRFDVVGESNYQDALEKICGGKKSESAHHEDFAFLLPESENTFDPNAVMVLVQGKNVGYLSRPDAARFKKGILRAMAEGDGKPVAVKAVVVGGWKRGHDEGHYGVRLFFDPVDFDSA